MNPIHIVIKEERRKAPRPLATVINADIRTPDGLDKDGMPKFITTPQPPQLHTLGERIDDMSNIIYAAEWDQRSPWITVHAGAGTDLKMTYMGWPTVTKEEWEAANPPGELNG